jgi:fructokinase
VNASTTSKERPVIVGVGEVLWDLLPAGPQLGGAPANFAYHAQALGARARVVTRVGNDRLGQEVLQRFNDMHLPIDTVQIDDQRPTGTVAVSLSAEGVPQFTIHEDVAWDRLSVTEQALQTVREADAVCFGSLAQRAPASRAAIQQLVSSAPSRAFRVFDVNLRQRFYSREVIEQSLGLANVLKLNNDELPILAEAFGLTGEARSQVESLARRFGLKFVVLTSGSKGSLIYRDGGWSEQTAQPTPIVDTVGAGDSFTAALVMGLLSNMALDEAHAFAAELARYVCSQAGATPALPPKFQKSLTR